MYPRSYLSSSLSGSHVRSLVMRSSCQNACLLLFLFRRAHALVSLVYMNWLSRLPSFDFLGLNHYRMNWLFVSECLRNLANSFLFCRFRDFRSPFSKEVPNSKCKKENEKRLIFWHHQWNCELNALILVISVHFRQKAFDSDAVKNLDSSWPLLERHATNSFKSLNSCCYFAYRQVAY